MNSIEELKQACHTSDGPYLRPFKPNPQWSDARIFVVGTNPATPMCSTDFPDFEEYWEALTKFPDRFDEVYAKKYGEKKESKSSRRASHLLRELEPLNVLVTNAMIYPSRKPKEIKPNKQEQRKMGLQAFQFLFDTCKPCAVLFHGSEALRLCVNAFGQHLDPHQPIAAQHTLAAVDWECHLFAFPHFSGQGVQKGYKVSEMNQELTTLAERIKQIAGRR